MEVVVLNVTFCIIPVLTSSRESVRFEVVMSIQFGDEREGAVGRL